MPAPLCVLALTFFISVISIGSQFARDIYEYGLYGVADLSFSDNARRVALIRQSVRNPQSLHSMTQADFDLLFRAADMTRKEANVIARHYHSDSCAIDVYFKGDRQKPDYVEFRALTLNADIEARFADATVDLSCLKDVLAARGVNTPESYASRPVPSWASPYSS